MRKQSALILVIVTIITLTAMLNIGSVYAVPPPTAIFTPNPVTQGTNVVATGNGYVASQTGDFAVFPDPSGLCGGLAATTAASSDAGGNLNPVTIPTSALSPGTHCLEVDGPFVSATLVTSFVVNAAPIPEYPLGLPLLAILAVIGYGVIRRKIRN